MHTCFQLGVKPWLPNDDSMVIFFFFFFFLLSRCAVTPPWSSSEQGSRVMSITVGGIWRACTTLWWSRHETSCRYRLVGALSLSPQLYSLTLHIWLIGHHRLSYKSQTPTLPPLCQSSNDRLAHSSFFGIQVQNHSVRVFGRWSYFSLLLLNLKPRGDWLGLKMK